MKKHLFNVLWARKSQSKFLYHYIFSHTVQHEVDENESLTSNARNVIDQMITFLVEKDRDMNGVVLKKSAHKNNEKAHGIQYEVETIDPDTARLYLSKHHDHETGKDLKKLPAMERRAIEMNAEAMRTQSWIMNGMPIIFDEEGRLVDGRMRLEACILADTPFKTLVARNISADTLHTIDQHRRRTYDGVLEARGVLKGGQVRKVMSKLIRIENGILGKREIPIGWSRYDRVFSANPEILEAVKIAETKGGNILHSTSRSVLILMALKAGHEAKIHEFMEALANPEDHEPTHPAVMLINQIMTFRGQKITIDVDTILALSILAFNDFIDGKSVRKAYNWTPNYGKAFRGKKKADIDDWKAVRDHAPRNLGLPLVHGYPGIEEGKFDFTRERESYTGDMADLVRSGIGDTSDIYVQMQTITPEKAKYWLENLNSSNRKLQKNHYRMIANDIKNGNWMVNAQPICFAGNPFSKDSKESPRLLNGQHRLMACVEADIPIEIPIAVNIPEQSFATYDGQAKRLVTDKVRKGDARVLSSAAKILWRVEQGFPPNTPITPSATDLVTTIRNHPGLAEAFPEARKMASIATAGIMTYMIYRVTRDHKEIGEQFLKDLDSGEELRAGNPVIQARHDVIVQRKGGHRNEVLGILERAWLDYKKYKGIDAMEDNVAGPDLFSGFFDPVDEDASKEATTSGTEQISEKN